MINAIYVDDEKDNPLTRTICNLLNETGRIQCDLKDPPADFSKIAEWNLDIFLIDYDLAYAKVDNKLIGYSGNSLATEVRNKKPACPIVLVSRKDALTAHGLNITTARSDLDLVLYKQDILSNKSKFQTDILTLYDGFKSLAEISGQPWSAVLELMQASPDESRRMREAFPPIEEGHRWFIPETAEWIGNVIIRYPGILYDDLHAAARLGISVSAFLNDTVQASFNRARYTGIFSGFGRRWWTDRLLQIAKKEMISAEISGTISEGFATAYQKLHEHPLELSVCTVDETPVADQICYIRREPVKRQNSILYYPDTRPPIMDAARVSLKAIRESNEFNEDLVDAESYDIVKELWESQ